MPQRDRKNPYLPGNIATLSDIGTTWLGLAVTTSYVYFGLTPPAPRENRERVTKASDDLEVGDKAPNISEKAASGAITKRIKR